LLRVVVPSKNPIRSGPGNDRRWRIGVVGNTNNYPFMVTQALRKLGHEAVQFVDRAEVLHRPENRYPEFASGYPDWIVDISHKSLLGWRASRCDRKFVRQQLRQFDFLLLNGNGPTIAVASRVPGFAMLTGSDLETEANWNRVWQLFADARERGGLFRGLGALVFAWQSVRAQRKAISRAFGVNYFLMGLAPVGDRILDSLGIGSSQRSGFMITDVDAERVQQIEPQQPAPGEPLRIFNVARLNWYEPRPAHLSALDMKGTDILLRGFADFIHRYQGRGELSLVRKGADVSATVALVAELELTDHVRWLDEMSQNEVFDHYERAHVVSEQLSTSVIGMGGLDAMACGRPVLANARPEVFEPMVGEPSPVLHATDAQTVCQHLLSLQKTPTLCASIGAQSRDYVRRNFSPDSAARLILQRWAAVQI
jgi:glycosyltransferase involved in cell wall biosynthesis